MVNFKPKILYYLSMTLGNKIPQVFIKLSDTHKDWVVVYTELGTLLQSGKALGMDGSLPC